MILVQDCIVSEDLLDRNFICKLDACKGACCIEGDRGAPLLESELREISNNLEGIKKHMYPPFIESLDKEGFYEEDTDGELVTTCQKTGACNFVTFKDGIAGCAIEEAYQAGDSTFRKPISCHLYPVRTKRYKEFEAVNYHQWGICSAACAHGDRYEIPIYQFVKEALIRKYGEDWYAELDAIARHLKEKDQ